MRFCSAPSMPTKARLTAARLVAVRRTSLRPVQRRRSRQKSRHLRRGPRWRLYVDGHAGRMVARRAACWCTNRHLVRATPNERRTRADWTTSAGISRQTPPVATTCSRRCATADGVVTPTALELDEAASKGVLRHCQAGGMDTRGRLVAAAVAPVRVLAACGRWRLMTRRHPGDGGCGMTRRRVAQAVRTTPRTEPRPPAAAGGAGGPDPCRSNHPMATGAGVRGAPRIANAPAATIMPTAGRDGDASLASSPRPCAAHW